MGCLKRGVCCVSDSSFEFECLGRAVDSGRAWFISDDGGDLQLTTLLEKGTFVDNVCASATASDNAAVE